MKVVLTKLKTFGKSEISQTQVTGSLISAIKLGYEILIVNDLSEVIKLSKIENIKYVSENSYLIDTQNDTFRLDLK